MNRIVAIILAIVLSVVSATAGIRHYCDYQGNVRQVADAQGNVNEQNDYYPYGGLFGESASRQSYKYSGKELERMNGLNTYDFHARPYYYPVLQFHSPDILSEEKPWNSPYLYCLGNPIMYIDNDGKRATFLGPEKHNALLQLQSYVQTDLTLTMESSGNIIYQRNHDRILKIEATDIMRVIDDESINVNINAVSDVFTSTGEFFIGGAFMGNEITTDSEGLLSISAFQEVNPNVLGTADDFTETPGKMMAHEFTEAYEGAIISKNNGLSSPPSNKINSVYETAHNRATPQTTVDYLYYDNNGQQLKVLKNNIVKGEWFVRNGNKTKVILRLMQSNN